MSEQQDGSVVGAALMESIFEEWYGEHGEFDDLYVADADDLRDLINRAVGRSAGAELVAIERARQISQEGYSLEHDREHGSAELRAAAQAYIEGDIGKWPWAPEWFKLSSDPIRNWTKAGALLAAAIDVERALAA